eukprot:1542624-Ditylum_brightwellii.AAC.3
MVFQITDKVGKQHTIELKNVLNVPDATKYLISINQWSEEQQDNRGILSRRRYFVFLWDNDKAQKLVHHPMHCRILIMQANEGGTEKFDNFLQYHSTCLYNQVYMLANNTKTVRPFWGLRRRGQQHTLSTADEKIQPEQKESQMA